MKNIYSRDGDWFFNMMNRVFPFLFIAVFCCVIAWGGFVAFTAYRVVSCAPACIGEAVGEVMKGFDKGRQ